MAIIRLVTEHDLENLWQIIKDGEIGLTTLPTTKSALKNRINLSLNSINSQPNQFSAVQYYLFVLVDELTHNIMGLAGILAATGIDEPFYSYKIANNHLLFCDELKHCTELCTFYIHPKYRKLHLGKQLSLHRIEYIKKNPTRFCPRIIAELRGFSNSLGISPFWESIGKKFFNLPYAIADQMTLTKGKKFITDCMPPHCIPLNLLKHETKEFINKVHPNTIPALKILQSAGFKYSNYIDIFDAGPTLIFDLQISE